MNSKIYTSIRFLLNKSYCTDEILNRVFCLSKPEVIARGITDWCKLEDTEGRLIVDWIKATDYRVRAEKRKARYKAWATTNRLGREGFAKATS